MNPKPPPIPTSLHGATPATERWVRRYAPRPNAKMRLFCFPYAGAGANVFRDWALRLPESIEVCAVEYPGRGTRLREPVSGDLLGLARDAGAAIEPLLDRPFAAVGYSFGALVAYEWVRRLAAAPAGPQPARLLLCARGGPELPPRSPPLHDLEESVFLARMQALFGPMPAAVLREPDLLALVLPPLRADLRAIDGYRHAHRSPLHIPMHVFGGDCDPTTSDAGLASWQAQTSDVCTVKRLRGGHFFINTDRVALRQAVLTAITPMIAGF